jgi:hypothetical protein
MIMGAAAEHRGNALIARQIDALITTTTEHEHAALALQIAADCDSYYRAVMDYLVEPNGLRADTIARMRQRRGWAPRNEALIKAHCAWIDADPRTLSGCVASVRRAKAAHALFIYALAGWSIPHRIVVPRAAT